MKIQELVRILEDNGLIIPDEFGRKWSEEYNFDSLFWNNRNLGNQIQTLRNDGNSSCGVEERVIYNLECESDYRIVEIRNEKWRSTLCHTATKREDKLCLVYPPSRKALVLETAREPAEDLGYGVFSEINFNESEGILKLGYKVGKSRFYRKFKGTDELD